MGQITTVLRRAGWRLGVARFIEALIVLSTASLGLALVLRVVQQLILFNVAWWTILAVTPAVVLVLALGWALARRQGEAAVARRVDEGADLREALSTAISLRGSDDPWARNMLESAEQQARGVNVARAVPIVAPRWWPSPLVAALVLLVVWLVVPPMDVLGRGAVAKKEQVKQEQVEQAKVESQAAVAKVAEALKRLDPEAGKDKAELELPKNAELKPDDIRRAAVKSLTNLKDRLEAVKNNPQMQAAQQTLDKLKQLRTPGQGPLSEVARELAKGDFKSASEALQKLAEKLDSKSLSAKEMEELKKQLESMSKQLADLAKDQSALEQKLQQMGLDKKLAGDPKALEAALQAGSEASKHLTQEQKQQLQQMAQAMQQTSQACQSMSQSMQQAAQASNKNGMGEQGQQAMSQMASQMGDMQAAAQDLASVQAGLSEAKFQMAQMSSGMGQCDNPGMGAAQNGMMGNGRFGEGDSTLAQGQGRGGPGQSQGGGGMGESEAPEKWQQRKFKTTNTGQGPIIGSSVVEGESIRGEAKAAFQSAVEAAEAAASEALESNVVERQYHGPLKHYTAALSGKAGKPGTTAPGASTPGTPAPEPKPASTPK